MKKAVAIVTCLITLGPATVLADSYRHTTVVVTEYRSHGVEERVVREVVTARPHQGRGNGRNKRYRASHDEIVYGRVVSVEPVYRVTPYNASQDSCVQYVDDGRRYRSHTPTILGAVIGAAVGHSIGDSHGDPKAAAIAGGVLGATLGRDIGEHIRESRRLVVNGPCQPGSRQYGKPEPVEYVVRYRYNGEVYRARMDHDPGEWIALDVDIKPA